MTITGPCSVEGAMATTSLSQYFRSFMVKLNMIESQLGELPRDGVQSHEPEIEVQTDAS